MDIILIECEQCGIEFEFQAEEQQRYDERGYDYPKRCSACRKRKIRPFYDREHKNDREHKTDREHKKVKARKR
jgi:hypothetical protein